MRTRLVPAVAAALVLVGAPAVAAQATTPEPAPTTEAPAEEAPTEEAPEEEPTEEPPTPEAPAEESEEPGTEEPEPAETPTPTETAEPEAEIVSVTPESETVEEGEGTTLTVKYNVSDDGELTVSNGAAEIATVQLAEGSGTTSIALQASSLEPGSNLLNLRVTADGLNDTATTTLTVNAAASTETSSSAPAASPSSPAPTTGTPSVTPSEESSTPEEAADVAAPTLEILNPIIQLQDLVRSEGEEEYGVKYVVTGLTPGETYGVSVTSPRDEYFPIDEFETDEDGSYSGVVYVNGSPEQGEDWTDLIGLFELLIEDADGEVVASGEFEVVGNGEDTGEDDANDDDNANPGGDSDEGPDLDASIAVSPDRLSSTDFVDRDKAVTITGTDFTPGESVTVTITPRGRDVEPFSITRTVGEDGTVVFSVYGTNSSNPEIYVGTYDVYVSEDDSDHGFADEFTVFTNGQSGGGGSYLPQTGGADGAGLALGGGLLALGIGAIVVTRRKPKGIGEA